MFVSRIHHSLLASFLFRLNISRLESSVIGNRMTFLLSLITRLAFVGTVSWFGFGVFVCHERGSDRWRHRIMTSHVTQPKNQFDHDKRTFCCVPNDKIIQSKYLWIITRAVWMRNLRFATVPMMQWKDPRSASGKRKAHRNRDATSLETGQEFHFVRQRAFLLMPLEKKKKWNPH